MWGLVPVLALLMCASVLRAPVTAIPPLLADVQADTRLDAVHASLLTSIPVLCFGALTPLASLLLRRVGINHGTVYCLLGVVVGSLVRSFGSTPGLYVGTIVLGAGLAIGNLSVPMLIGRQFQHRAALLTGAYSATINVAVTVVTATAAPVATVIGWRWSAAWGGAVLGAVALVGWVVVCPPGVRGVRASVRRTAGLPAVAPMPRDRRRPPVRRVSRWRVVWLLVAAFSGHTLAYYAMTAWLPTALADMRHMTAVQAGLASSIFQGAGIAGPLLVPVMLDALRWSIARTIAVVSACWIALPVGLMAMPAGWPAWSVLGGIAQGAFFTALFVVVIRRSRSVDENRRISSLVQTIGYSVAAAGPVITGWIHTAIPNWLATFAGVCAMLVVMALCALLAVTDSSQPSKAGASR